MVYYRDVITTISSGSGTYDLHASSEFNPSIFSGGMLLYLWLSVNKMFCQPLFVFEMSMFAIVLPLLRITDSL